MIDHKAWRSVLDFKDAFKPDTVVHLGDFCDTAALRAGASTSSDQYVPMDLDIGIQHLKQLRPTHVCLGNHEDRIPQLCNDHRTIVREYGIKLMAAMVDGIRDAGAEHWQPYDMEQGFDIGGYRYMHGTLYGENCIRDAAETYGNVVFGHSHRPGMATARNAAGAIGYNTGWLGDVSMAGYAKNRRSTLSWKQGFVWGYYKGDQSVLWQHIQPKGQTEWILPL